MRVKDGYVMAQMPVRFATRKVAKWDSNEVGKQTLSNFQFYSPVKFCSTAQRPLPPLRRCFQSLPCINHAQLTGTLHKHLLARHTHRNLQL